LTSIARNVSLKLGKVGESREVWSGNSWHQGPEVLFRSSVCTNINVKDASCHLYTLHTPEVPCEGDLSSTVGSIACSFSAHSRSRRCAFSFDIGTIASPVCSLDCDNFLIV
jgi:hypothetical protein